MFGSKIFISYSHVISARFDDGSQELAMSSKEREHCCCIITKEAHRWLIIFVLVVDSRLDYVCVCVRMYVVSKPCSIVHGRSQCAVMFSTCVITFAAFKICMNWIDPAKEWLWSTNIMISISESHKHSSRCLERHHVQVILGVGSTECLSFISKRSVRRHCRSGQRKKALAIERCQEGSARQTILPASCCRLDAGIGIIIPNYSPSRILITIVEKFPPPKTRRLCKWRSGLVQPMTPQGQEVVFHDLTTSPPSLTGCKRKKSVFLESLGGIKDACVRSLDYEMIF